jgi:16S rRNA (adenine1518-N6/adenine1519-N6)-dimethyltransferase
MLKKSLSQNLIKDKNILSKMVRLAGIEADDIVVEIGAGQGDLTRCLAEAAGNVYGVELDRTFAEPLNTLERSHKNLTVIFGNFLTIPLASFKGERPIKVMGNIPYKITGAILSKLIDEREDIASAHITVQKEIGERMVSRPYTRAYGGLSVICQLLAEVKILFTIKARSFVPPPKVDSVFLSLLFKEEAKDIREDFLKFVHICFEHKRKHLRYTLAKHFTAHQIAELYLSMGFQDSVRAEEIEPEKFVTMFHILYVVNKVISH